jgi:hypothetical protein
LTKPVDPQQLRQVLSVSFAHAATGT